MATEPAQARLYVAGPMSGLPDLNRPAFDLAGRKLRGVGFDVANPADLTETDLRPVDFDRPGWPAWMRAALTLMLTADGVALLPGWRESRGASLEADLARNLGMPRLPVVGWLTAAGQDAYMGRLLSDRPE